MVVTGRVADPSLAVGPAMAHFGWAETDWDELGRATIAGHLIECGAQVTGGYFADPGFKDVPDLHAVGFPIVEVAADGSFVVGKARGTGGVVDCRTVKEQLLYEVHDPAAYLTPDVVADISEAEVEQVGPDRVAVHGVRGHPRPETLKVIVCFAGGWLGEGEISYAGPNAEARARLAADVVRRRVGDGLGYAVRSDRRAECVRRRRGPRPRPASARGRPGRAAARRRRAPRPRPGRGRAARGDGAVHLRPGRRRGRADGHHPAAHSASCLVPRDLVPATFRFVEE